MSDRDESYRQVAQVLVNRAGFAWKPRFDELPLDSRVSYWADAVEHVDAVADAGLLATPPEADPETVERVARSLALFLEREERSSFTYKYDMAHAAIRAMREGQWMTPIGNNILLASDSLLSKWGFNDGDEPETVDTVFDRTLCACGVMHTRCHECGHPVEECDAWTGTVPDDPETVERVKKAISSGAQAFPWGAGRAKCGCGVCLDNQAHAAIRAMRGSRMRDERR